MTGRIATFYMSVAQVDPINLWDDAVDFVRPLWWPRAMINRLPLIIAAIAISALATSSSRTRAQVYLPAGCEPGPFEDELRAKLRCEQEAEAQAAANRQKQARDQADVERLRIALLKQSPLPATRNPLLGKWGHIRSQIRPQDDPLGIASIVGARSCETLFGGGEVEFLSGSWTSGGRNRGPVQYRLSNGNIFAIPAQGPRMLSFKVMSDGRVRSLQGISGTCDFQRVGGAPTIAAANVLPNADTRSPAGRHPSAAGTGFAILGVRLGTDTADLVDRNIKARGGESLPGYLETQGRLRIYSRNGNFRDIDQRTSWTRYDFDGADASSRLISVTLGFVREPGPTSVIYRDRRAALSTQYGPMSGPATGPYQVRKGGIEITLLDDPASQQVLETYALVP